MNYTSLDEAYKIHHINSTTYSGSLKYNSACIYCNYKTSTPLMADRDGGAFRRCDKCWKQFMASSINPAISNFRYSTFHLKGTN